MGYLRLWLSLCGLKFFADIFRNNSLNVGILPIQISEVFLDKIFKAVIADTSTELEVNLPNQAISLVKTGGNKKNIGEFAAKSISQPRTSIQK